VLDGEPFAPPGAKKRIRAILDEGNVSLSNHAEEELTKDGMTMVDVTNVLRGGVVEPAELERGSFRYRVRTNRMVVVVAFRSETELRVVTVGGLRDEVR
jgi:hypothetical protein